MGASRKPHFRKANWRILGRQYKSLPGQQLLFAEDVPQSIEPAEEQAIAEQCGELFYTGKDLPGANETLQVILWDVQ